MSWSRRHDACIECGTTARKHSAHGLCRSCYRSRSIAGTLPAEKPRRWSFQYDACVECGETQRRHWAHGMCEACYRRAYRATESGGQKVRAANKRYVASPRGREKNQEKNRRSTRIARERLHGLEADIPLGYEGLIFDVFGARCAACGATQGLTLDHHRPIESGYALLHNAVPLCRSCNARKRNKPPHMFYDGWKLAEIAVRLWETRAEFEIRFPELAAL